MSLLKMIMEAQGGQGLGQLAQKFGIDESDLGGLAGMVAPAISSGAKRRAAQPGGLEAMLGQMMGEGQGRYLDDPAAAAEPEAREQGAHFLEQILGSRDATQALGQAAAERTGVAEDKVSEVLPALAAMLQGGMQRQMPDSTLLGMLGGASGSSGGSGAGGIMGMITGLLGGAKGAQGGLDLGALNRMLDADGDGSALDDVLERFMK
ncbi:MAG: DUF937 domain-containing protein [Pseudomonadota bacterium]